MKESGIPLGTVGWTGVMGPRGVPAPIVERLNAAINKVLGKSEIKEAFKTRGITVVQATPQQFRQFVQSDIDNWTEVVKVSGVKIE
jgi:tripartite-type tricarboxylate transporter receptor subunit TctC